MRPDPLLDPKKLPTYLMISVAISISVGAIVWQVSGREWLALATAVFLFVADYIGLKMLLGRDD